MENTVVFGTRNRKLCFSHVETIVRGFVCRSYLGAQLQMFEDNSAYWGPFTGSNQGLLISLLNSEGSLLALSGYGDKDTAASSAIASNVWSSYQKSGQLSLDDGKLDCVLVECKEGKMAITKVANLLLCMTANENVSFGMLKAKIQAMSTYLEEPLSQVAAS